MRRSPSFRAWLLGLTLASSLPLVAFACWLVVVNHLAARDSALLQVQQTARALAQAMERQLRTFEAVAVTAAASDALRRGALEEFYVEAQRIVKREAGIVAIILYDRKGQQLVNTLRPLGEKLPARRDPESIRAVVQSRAPRVTNLFRGVVLDRFVVGVDAPVLVEGEVKYVLSVSISLETLAKLLEDQKLPAGWLVGLFDRNGVLVGRSRAAERYVGQPGAPLLLAGMRRAAEGSVETPALEGDMVISTWSRLQGSGWAAAVAIPKSDFTARLWNNLGIVIAVGLLVLAMGAAAAVASAGFLARRVGALSAGAAALGEGKAFAPRPLGVRELDRLAAALGKAGDVLRAREQERDAAELRRRVLSAELDHRVKNILAVAQALGRQTLGRSEKVDAYMGRLRALASSHGALAETTWSGVGLRRLVEVAIAPFGRDGDSHFTIEGPDADLTPRVAQSLALILHELGTNAAKYGALAAGGCVAIRWQRAASTDKIAIDWTESGGAPIREAPKRGLGTNLIERLASYDLGGAATFDYRAEGLHCRIDLALSDSSAAPARTPPAVAARPPGRGALDGKRVLIVEDASLTALAIEQTVVEAGGAPVGPFHSLRSASAAVDAEALDAALLDVNVNGELVFPLADRLRQRGIPVLFVTGYSETHLWPSAWQDAPRLVKPVSARDLEKACAALFGR